MSVAAPRVLPATAPRPRPARRAPNSAIYFALTFFCFLGLYIRLYHIGRYNITIGGVLSTLVLLLSLRRVAFRTTPLLVGLSAMLWPLALYAGFMTFDVQLIPKSNQFLLSYALWVTSMSILTLAFLSLSPVQARAAFVANVIITAMCCIQVGCAAILHRPIGYTIVKPLTGVDIFHGYVGISMDYSARAIGLVYEPSMCGRIIGTLCFIDVLVSGKVARNMLLAVLGLVLTKSLGLLVLVAAIGIILFARSARQFVWLAVGLSIVFAGGGAYITRRLQTHDAQGGTSSTYRRTIAPLKTMSYVISNYPLGMPVASNQLVSTVTGYTALTGEAAITNGTYEFIIYTGLVGIAAILMGLVGVVLAFIRNERELAAALLYLIMSAALSGSFLSIESSLLTYFFVTTCLIARRQRSWQARLDAWARRRARQPIPATRQPYPSLR
jgi:hypothetical protein